MKVLVAYASKYGATREVAERIAATLRESGVEVDVCPAKDRPEVTAYDAVILGSAVFTSSWMSEAADFATSNAAVRAREYCDLYRLDKESFDRVIANYPAFADTIRELAARRATPGAGPGASPGAPKTT